MAAAGTGMGNRFRATAYAAALAAVAVPVHAQETSLLERAGVAELALRELRQRAAPGGVVALVREGRVEVQAIGHSDPERTVTMLPERLFGTGGLAGAIAGLVAAALAGEGAIDPALPIRTWAPDLPERVGAITLEQLLGGRSGLDDARDEPPRRRPGPRVWPGATDRALFTEPGALYSPSRHAPALARAILVAATGEESFESLAGRVVFAPAGMRSSTFDALRADALGAVPGMVVSTGERSPMLALLPRASPVPQLYTTAGDLARLLQAGMEADGPLPRAFEWLAAARAVRPADPRDSVGAGVLIGDFHGHRMIRYEGGIGGYGTVVRWLPGAATGVVALTNATGALLTGTADGLLRHALGNEAMAGAADGPPPPPANTPAADSAYAGTWANGDRIILLELADGRLFWRDGDLRLEVRREGGVLDVVVADGRVAQRLRWYADAAGRPYLLAGDLAYRKVTPRFRR